MSVFWFLLWFILSAIIIGAFVWQTHVLFKQKKAWKAYAKMHGLHYTKGQFLASPAVNGYINDYFIGLFSAERQATDVRQRKLITAVEIKLPEGLVDGGAAGTPEMLSFLGSLSKLHVYPVQSKKWDPKNKFFAHYDESVQAYLNEERTGHIDKILRTKNADVLIIFDDKEAVIRLETSDPMHDPDKIDKIIGRILSHAEGLRISKKERAAIRKKVKQLEDGEAEPEEV